MNKIKFTMLLIIISIQINAFPMNDTLSINEVVKVEIVQSIRKDEIVVMMVENLSTDTIFLRSNFTLNNPHSLSHILINISYTKDDSDSIFWYWNYVEFDPIVIKYSNGTTIIPPKTISSFEIPVAESYIGESIFFKVKLLLGYRKWTYFLIQETNKISLSKRENNEE